MMNELAPGQVIADKYRVERVLGEGGMGFVVAAHHLKLDQRVALKFLKPEALKHPHVVQRFAREARAAAKIRGEHVARVIDVGDLPSGSPYIVMEYLDGEDLARRLHERGPLPIAETVGYMLQACEALAEAHAAGIVHRDLKPPNLFLARSAGRATVKVLDFGISKTLEEDAVTGRNLTSTSMVMGTPHYMSPEQLRSSRDVDARSDIWALGVVLFELLAGEPPFDGENTTAIITAIVLDEPRQLLQLRPDTPPELASVVHRCLAKRRDERYASVLELARALAPFAGNQTSESLQRIESIAMPRVSIAPSAATERAPDLVLPTTRHDPVDSSLAVPTARTVDVSGQRTTDTRRESETRATWDATLAAAAPPTSTTTGRLRLLVPAALLGVGLLAVWLMRAGPSVPTAEPRPAAASSSLVTTPTPPASPTPTASTFEPAPAAAPAVPVEGAPSGVVPPSPAPVASVASAPAAAPRKPELKVAKTTPNPLPRDATEPSSKPAASAATPAGGSLRMGIK
jgi:serine/threonine-protein kinase